MIIKEVITKAKEYGYFWDSSCEYVCPESHFMNPDFWEALGKALGWEKQDNISKKNIEKSGGYWSPKNAYYAHHFHKFIDHVIDGGSIESFFDTL